MSHNFVAVYKPNNKNTGTAAQFKMGNKRDCMFLEVAKQVRPKEDKSPYDWTNKFTVKLGVSDIGKILALLNGALPPSNDPQKEDLGLFHNNAKGNKVIKFKKQNNGYYVKISCKEGEKVDNVAFPLSVDEAELLRIALVRGYEIILGW